MGRQAALLSGKLDLIEQGALYPALYSLQRQGLLETEWSTSEAHRRARYYSLTKAGRKRLQEETKGWNPLAAAMAGALAVRIEEV